MKKKTIFPALCLLMLGLFISAAAQEAAYKSQAVTEPKQIDGQPVDWEGANFVNFKKAGVDYAVAHDSGHLYLILVFNTEEGLSTADQGGVFIYLSQGGKKSKDVGFHFIKKVITAEEAIARMEALGDKLTEERKAQIKERKMYNLYEGEPVGKKFKADLQKVKGQRFEPAIFRGRVERARGGPAAPGQAGFQKAVFEFKIPLQPSPGLPPLVEPGKPINLGIEWGGLTEEMKKELMTRRAEAATRATGTDSRMVVSGDEPSEGGFDRGGGELDRKTLPKKFNFWFGLLLGGQ
ncbi:MAG: hypothetical protein QHH43_09075 [Candidatus Saccharicenans sp.]|jgi:hypothetical protein|nr:hypothetical protein [Candidatus Saccharicenans sp.]MDH7575894.1 hypothetical protein [Candidatus Saccharicenans sp.]